MSDPASGTDWIRWHDAYGDRSSALSRRLALVRQRIAAALDDHGHPVEHILSLCAGDGRDVLPELAIRPGLSRRTTLVELDPRLGAAARALAGEAGLAGVEIRTGDAGRSSTWIDVAPVDLLLLCGIFGNISDDDVHATVRIVPSLLRIGGTVIWTRGHLDRPVDLRPVIRGWFAEAGLTEVAFDGDPEPFGVGVARLDRPDPGPPRLVSELLFDFVR